MNTFTKDRKDMIAPRKTLHSTPLPVIQQALELAQVDENDVLCDVGCGDGRVLLYAASQLQVKKCIGIEIDEARVQHIQDKAARMGLPNGHIQVHCGNALEIEIDPEVTVIFLFLIERGLRQIFQKLNAQRRQDKELRIVTYLYKTSTMDPYLVSTQMCKVDVTTETAKSEAAFPIYLYKLPPNPSEEIRG
ncbi:hypothetical protein AeMF1_020931 [Aphanomyces euteiches]|nr:hypothetical protein AeMF1_020931 [Aphanomyces euteiches]KAH9194889.1 hypothetical protein AeNC1_003139 [Aphanomyces euteiches]